MKKHILWAAYMVSMLTSLAFTACGGGGAGPANSIPVASAGAEQYVIRGDLVTLNGIGSKDNDGDELKYRWSFTSVPVGSSLTDADLSDPTVVNPAFTADVEGTYFVALIVNDGTVDSSPDTVTITASTVKLAKTGQTTNFVEGDDGALQKGVAWPDPRFIVNADTSITDNLTGLAWAPNGNLIPGRDPDWDQDGTVNDGAVTWQHALDYIEKLNAESYLGYSDWRLPNRRELRTLINYEQVDELFWLNAQGIGNMQSDYYWSSSTNAYGIDIAWRVSLVFHSIVLYSMGAQFYVLPVRTGLTGNAVAVTIPRTGQVTSFSPGDDGDLKVGSVWPDPRFTVNADTSITDNLTGLAWAPNGNVMPLRDSDWDQDGTANDGAVTWQHALDYIKKLNTEDYLGHSDWRLPNINELECLLHIEYSAETCSGYPCASIAAWLKSAGFYEVQLGSYWSSDTYMATPSGVPAAGMSDGQLYVWAKSAVLYVWPVRGGQ